MGIDDLVRMLRSTNEARRRPRPTVGGTREAELHRVLREAAGGLGAIPRGWGRLLRETEKLLQSAAATVEARGALEVTGLYVLGSQPVVRLSNDDPVVRGIYRRALARARHTCQVCGRNGRCWNELSRFQILCTRCAAPHVIAADLDQVDELRNLYRRLERDAVAPELPERLTNVIAELLDGSKDCQTVERAAPTSAARPLTTEEFDRWCNWLLALRANPMFAQALASAQ